MKKKYLTTSIVIAFILLMFALAYASVPLYELFCQVTGYGGSPKITTELIGSKENKIVQVILEGDVASNLPWTFVPLQSQIDARIGEPVLAFYRAINNSDEAIVGVSTYNVLPVEVAGYFNKIQCFCFEEQCLNPQEVIDMPVLFYIDPEILEDTKASQVAKITLSYTFFKTS